MTAASRSAASAAAFVACNRIAILVLLPPKLYLVFFGALDASFAHLDVVLDLSLRELAVLPEDDVEAKSEYAERYKHQSR